MKDKLYAVLTKCGLFFERVSRQIEAQGLSGLRSLMKSHLTINARLRNTQLHCQAHGLRRSRTYSFGGQSYCNVGLQGQACMDLAAGHIPSVQERVLTLPPEACFYQYPLRKRVYSVARFGWC